MTARSIRLKAITAPATEYVLDAPPVLKASEHSIDF